jgi:hypothetical protein
MNQIPHKYAGQYVALMNEQVIASGKTSLETYRKAKRIHPKKMVTLEYVPTKKETITFL